MGDIVALRITEPKALSQNELRQNSQKSWLCEQPTYRDAG
jgi:hypothetical protein